MSFMFRRLVLKVVLCFTGCDTYFLLNLKKQHQHQLNILQHSIEKNCGCSVVLSSSLNIEFDISFERGSELCDDYLPLSHSSPSDEMCGSCSSKNVMIRETFCNTRTFSRHKSQCALAHSQYSARTLKPGFTNHISMMIERILD